MHPSCHRGPPPPHPPPASPRSGFLSVLSADNREACCIAGESHGITSVSLRITDILWQGRCCCGAPGCSWGLLRLHCRLRPPPSLLRASPPPFLFCIVLPCLTDTEPIIISFPQGPAPFVWQTLQTVSIPFSPCLVLAAVAHRRCLINAASYFIFTSCSLFDPPSPQPTPVNPPHLKLTASAGYLYHI